MHIHAPRERKSTAGMYDRAEKCLASLAEMIHAFKPQTHAQVDIQDGFHRNREE
jgi:hypothetical protein